MGYVKLRLPTSWTFTLEFRATLFYCHRGFGSEQRKMFALVIIAWTVGVRADMVPNLEVSLVRRSFY